MMRRQNNLAIAGLAMICGIAGQVVAQEADQVYRSAYFSGRGNTGIAIADDEDAIFYNPAGIASGKGIYKKTVLLSPMVELSNSTKDLVREVAVENDASAETIRKYIGSPQHVGIYNFTGIVLRRAALGIVGSGTNSVLVYKNKDAGALESVQLRSRAYGGGVFTLADSFFDQQFQFGVTGKYLQKYQADVGVDVSRYEQVAEESPEGMLRNGAGGGMDIGAMYRGSGRLGPSFGLTVQDVGDTSFLSSAGGPDPDPNRQTLNFGFAIAPGTKVSTMRLLVDYRDVLGRQEANAFKKLHLGGEFSIRDTIGVTAGLNQGYPSAGFYLDLYLLRLDLGFYTQETGEYAGHRGDSRLFFKLTAGF